MEIREPAGRSRMYHNIKIALIVLACVLVLLCVYLVRDYFALRRENAITARKLSLSAFVKKHGPLTADETGIIRPWMTFDYINRTFALPPDFLKSSFRIDDAHYPNVILDQYSKSRNFDTTEFMLSVEAAIGNYLKQH